MIITDLVSRRKRCGLCTGCTSSDCGSCAFCLDMPKFGGKGARKQCLQRRCNKLSNKCKFIQKFCFLFILSLLTITVEPKVASSSSNNTVVRVLWRMLIWFIIITVDRKCCVVPMTLYPLWMAALLREKILRH